MAKQIPITLTGVVTNCFPNAMFEIELENSHKVLCTISGRIRTNNIMITLRDRVDIEVSAYDWQRGRITYRHAV